MEVIVFFALILVVVVKGFTTHSLHALEAKIRAAQADEADITQRLQSTESALRALEKEHKTLEQEVKHLENDKDLATLEVVKAGGRPITEEQLQQLMGTIAKPASSQTKPLDNAPDPQLNTQQEQIPNNPSDAESKSPPTQKQTHNEPTDTSSAQMPSARPRILVVDDNDELRALLLQALNKDYEVLEAPDGFEALSQILKQKEKYDLIITDLNMPNVNGITLLEHLPNHIPTIIISAFLNKPEFKKSLAALKPSSILEKPFQIAALRTAIQEALTS